jgi:hypothetical protein
MVVLVILGAQVAAEFKMAAKLTLFSQSLKSFLKMFKKLISNYRIFMELFFSKKIQNGGFIQDGGNLSKLFQELSTDQSKS